MRETRLSLVQSVHSAKNLSQEAILARAGTRIESVSRDKPDLILLTELFANAPTGQDKESTLGLAQTVPGPISEELSALARKHQTFIAFGLLRKSDDRVFNSMVLLDREGAPVWIFDKVTPVPSESTACGMTPGGKPTPYEAPFGKLGAALCFDINYTELAEYYFRHQIELMLFPSMFPGGRLLESWAVRYGFAIASCTWYDTSRILDCTGREVARTSDLSPTATAVLNLNRRVVHMDGNMDKLERMRTKYPGDVIVEDQREEATVVITSLKKGLEVADLIAEFEIETLPDYFARSRGVRAEHGGWPS